MMRLHLVTSRKPIAGAVNAGDRLVFMDTKAARELLDELLSESSQISMEHLRIIKQSEDQTDIGLKAIDYKALVKLVTSSNSVVSW